MVLESHNALVEGTQILVVALIANKAIEISVQIGYRNNI